MLQSVALALLATTCTSVANAHSIKRQAAIVYPNATYPNTTYPDAIDPEDVAGSQWLQKSDPFYPSPWINPDLLTPNLYPGWEDAYAKAKDFVSQLTLMEKVNLTTGIGWEGEQCVGNTGSVPRLGLRSLCMQDSPVGVRDTDYNTVFSSGQTVAATFDRDLMYARGYAMGKEHKAKGVTVQLGPVAGPIGRSPEGGRNWEGFSPDPVLTGIGMSSTIKGVQDAGIIACAKHFIGNEQEHFRQVPESQQFGYNITATYSSNIDDTTMHELYLWPFADAVRAGVGSVMCSYNQINNSQACQNSKTVNNLLKDELGFQGFVMSDWQGQHSGVPAALAGLDMAMPGDTLMGSGWGYWGPNLTLAVVNGTVPEWRIDDMVMRIMTPYFAVGLTLDEPEINFSSFTADTYGPLHYSVGKDYQQVNWHVDVRADHHKIVREIGARATVLLKNNGALPLKNPKFVAVIGEDAGMSPYGANGCSDRGCDNGTLAMAWGSGSANFASLVTPQAALSAQAIEDGTRFESITDNYATTEIAALVSQPLVTSIVFVNADSGEGYILVDGNLGDRNNLTLWQSGDALIKNVSSMCNNTIVVIHSTGPVLVNEWYESPNITAILWAGIPGDQSGNSITDVLYGKVNPAARTPFTWAPTRESYGTDILYKPNNGESYPDSDVYDAPQLDYEEGVFIDYKALDRANITPIYEFGYGLSYTTFEYSDIKVNGSLDTSYAATSGFTAEAPVLGKYSTNLSDYIFPSDEFPWVGLYIYPYLNFTDAFAASADVEYGANSSDWLPAKTGDGSAQPLLGAGGGPGGNPALYDILFTVTATVTNTGDLDGEEVPQLYINLGGPNDPKVALRGFERLSIDKGASATFTVDLTRRDLSNWDTISQNWVITDYPKTVYVGSSSKKLPLTAVLA